MELPKEIKLQAVMFTDGAKGSFSQTYRNDEFGIVACKYRESRDLPVKQEWSIKTIDDRVFPNYGELRKAVNEMNKGA